MKNLAFWLLLLVFCAVSLSKELTSKRDTALTKAILKKIHTGKTDLKNLPKEENSGQYLKKILGGSILGRRDELSSEDDTAAVEAILKGIQIGKIDVKDLPKDENSNEYLKKNFPYVWGRR